MFSPKQNVWNMHNKHLPFLTTMKERGNLSKAGSSKNTLHFCLGWEGSPIQYEVGDSVGIYPRHDQKLVEDHLHFLESTGEETVFFQKSSKKSSFREFLTSFANLSDISPKLLQQTALRQSSPMKRGQLLSLLEEESYDLLKEYLQERYLLDFLQEHEEVRFSPQELADLCMPLMPRFYSIASSQKKVGGEIHLAVAPVEYTSPKGLLYKGVCTHYLANLAPLHEPDVRIFIQSSPHFRLPTSPKTPLIMIGPGTGVAPFRAFVQERILQENTGRQWLFFGERNRAFDFFYEEEWLSLEQAGKIRLSLAFSRDQAEKCYVQHRIEEEGKEIFDWLEQGASLYVCGDAKKMAIAVEEALLKVISVHGFGGKEISCPQAKEYLKSLKQQKRYLKDIY